MALGPSAAEANAFLDSHMNSRWVKLHVGDPGSAGTANAAAETARKQITAASAAGGSKSTSAALEWTNVAATEAYTHYSKWTAESGGTFTGSGTITGGSVTAGNNFTVPIGDFTISINVAA